MTLRIGIVLLGLLATPAFAQSDYPNRPIRVIVPFAPGGGVDVMARLFAEKAAETPEDFGRFVRAQVERASKLLAGAGFTPQ